MSVVCTRKASKNAALFLQPESGSHNIREHKLGSNGHFLENLVKELFHFNSQVDPMRTSIVSGVNLAAIKEEKPAKMHSTISPL